MASEAIIWNNNFNDEQSADTITGTVAGTHGTGMNTLSAHSIQQYDANSRDVGRAQWAIGDQFTVENDSTNTLYEVTSAGWDPEGVGSGAALTNAVFGITPSPAEAFSNGDTITKEDSYKGTQGSAENHLRKRNMGLI